MKCLDLILIAFFLFGSPQTGSAAAMSARISLAAKGSQTLDLDAPDGIASSWKREDLTNINTIRANFTVRRVGGGENPGGFLMQLSNGGADDVRFIALGYAGKSTIIPTFAHSANREDKPCFVGTAMVSIFEIGETVEIEINWTDAGVVQFFMRNRASRQLNNDAERCVLTMKGGPPTSLEVTSMQGRAQWAPLTLGLTEIADW